MSAPSSTAKDAGWIGIVPTGWSVARLSFRYTQQLGKMLNPDAVAGTNQQPYLGNKDVQWGRVVIGDLSTMTFTPAERVRFDLRHGDLLICEGGEVGRTAIWYGELEPCYFQKAIHRLRPLDLRRDEPRFLFYCLVAAAKGGHFEHGGNKSTIGHLTGEALRAHRFPFPPLSTQKAIADFLDRKTAAIDALIEKKQKLLDLLAEKRAALINQAVTKGLDSSVPMKDSGVAWIGEIPAHWEIHRLRRVVRRFVDYRGRTPEKSDHGVPLITAGAVRHGRVDHKRAPEWVSKETHAHLVNRGRPEVGDLLFTSEAPLGEVGVIKDPDVACAQRIIMFKVESQRMDSGFLLLHFLADSGRGEIWSRASGSTAAGIRADRLKMSMVPTPPLSEQRAVAAFVAAETEGFDEVDAIVKRQLEHLQEYRQALITAAVTGQLEIPEEAA